jgi:hypothetical protein
MQWANLAILCAQFSWSSAKQWLCHVTFSLLKGSATALWFGHVTIALLKGRQRDCVVILPRYIFTSKRKAARLRFDCHVTTALLKGSATALWFQTITVNEVCKRNVKFSVEDDWLTWSRNWTNADVQKQASVGTKTVTEIRMRCLPTCHSLKNDYFPYTNP